MNLVLLKNKHKRYRLPKFAPILLAGDSVLSYCGIPPGFSALLYPGAFS